MLKRLSQHLSAPENNYRTFSNNQVSRSRFDIWISKILNRIPEHSSTILSDIIVFTQLKQHITLTVAPSPKGSWFCKSVSIIHNSYWNTDIITFFSCSNIRINSIQLLLHISHAISTVQIWFIVTCYTFYTTYKLIQHVWANTGRHLQAVQTKVICSKNISSIILYVYYQILPFWHPKEG